MPYSRYSDDSDREYVLMPVKSAHGGSEYGGRGRRRQELPIEVNNFLEVPQSRPRASSQGGGVAPTIVNIGGALTEREGRDRGHSRSRSHHRHRYRDGSTSSSSYSSDRSRSRHRRRPERHSSSKKDPITEEDLPYKFRKELDFARRAHDDDEEKRIMDRIKRDRDAEKRRWKLEEEEEAARKKKEREAILLEAKLDEDRKKKEQDELRRKILKDEEERQEKEKAKKKAEEDEFERKVKEKFMNAGMHWNFRRHPGPPYY